MLNAQRSVLMSAGLTSKILTLK